MSTHATTTCIKASPLRKTAATAAILMSALTLSGCLALPPAIQVGSLVLDSISFAATGKTVSDHAISAVTQQDCAMSRVLEGNDICTVEVVAINDMVVMADIEHTMQDTSPNADALARNIVPARFDADFHRQAAYWDPGAQTSANPEIATKF